MTVCSPPDEYMLRSELRAVPEVWWNPLMVIEVWERLTGNLQKALQVNIKRRVFRVPF